MTRSTSSNQTQRSRSRSGRSQGRSTSKATSGTQRSTSTQSKTKGSAEPKRSADSERTSGTEGATQGPVIELPFVTARFHTPDLSLPSGEDVSAAAEKVRNQLPSTERSLFIGALTLGAVFSWIEWPVAVAIGVGTSMAGHSKNEHASTG